MAREVDFPLYSAPWFAEGRGVEDSPALFIFDAAGRELFRAEGPDAGDLPALANARLAELAKGKSSPRK